MPTADRHTWIDAHTLETVAAALINPTLIGRVSRRAAREIVINEFHEIGIVNPSPAQIHTTIGIGRRLADAALHTETP